MTSRDTGNPLLTDLRSRPPIGRLLSSMDAVHAANPNAILVAPEEIAVFLDALEALNALRSNIVGTQRASWSNVAYPLVAILNAAGLEQFDPTEEQLRQHLDCYGGAGGYPGHEIREPATGWCEPVSRLQLVSEAARWFLDDPSEKNRGYLEARLERA